MSFMALAGAIGAGATGLLGAAGMATGVGSLGAAIGSGIGAVGAGALGGAGLGALSSAITGGDIGKGALFGALGGGITGGLGSALGGMGGSAAGAGTGSAAGSAGAPVAAAGQTAGNVANTAGSLANTAGSSLTGVAPGGGAFVGPQVPVTLATSQTGGIMPGSVINAMGGASNIPAGAVPASSGVGAVGNTIAAPTGLPALAGADAVKAQLAGTLFGQYPGMTIGAGSMLGSYLGSDNQTTQAGTPIGTGGDNFLSYYKFKPRRYRPSQPFYIKPANYADGGIASLNPNSTMMQSGPAQVDFMGEDAYPMSQQKLNFYSTPTQMPTSAQQVMASYEPATNPLTGQPISHFDGGGIAQIPVGGKVLRGPGDGVSDDIRANIEGRQEARLADGEYVVPARAVSELGNGSTDAGAKKLSAMVDRIHKGRRKASGRKNIAVDSRADRALPA